VGGCVHWMQREPCASSPAPLTRAGQWGYPFILAKTRSPGRKLCGILSSLYAPLLVLLVCVRLRSVFQADTDSPGSDTVGEERRLVSAAVSAHSIFFFFCQRKFRPLAIADWRNGLALFTSTNKNVQCVHR